MAKKKKEEAKALEFRLKDLCQTVFGSKDGQELLYRLGQLYRDVELVKDNPNMVYYAIGKHDLIQEMAEWSKVGNIKEPLVIRDELFYDD